MNNPLSQKLAGARVMGCGVGCKCLDEFVRGLSPELEKRLERVLDAQNGTTQAVIKAAGTDEVVMAEGRYESRKAAGCQYLTTHK